MAADEHGRPAYDALVDLPAHALSRLVRRREVSCRQVMEAHLDRIARLNPVVNAIVRLRPHPELLAEADHKDALLERGEHQGWLHGLPVAVKDLNDVAGLPTTKGFFRPPFDAPLASTDCLVVARMRAAGALFVGKTNTPEFGLGSHTYNPVFGTTLNAWDQTRTAGGSSGGAAVAVALRMLPVADGSDFFGSLRNPTGWNNVLGLRPSFGRVPSSGEEVFVSQGGVDGPVARTATDLRLLLRTMAGWDPRDPFALSDVLAEEPAPVTGRRVAWMGDLGGYLPMEPEVLEVCRTALGGLEQLGLVVEQVDDLPSHGTFRGTEDLWATWLVWRHLLAGSALKPVHDDPVTGPHLKPEAVFEVEGLVGAEGRPPLSADEVFEGSRRRSGLFEAMRRLFERFDYVVLPTAQLFAFDATLDWPHEIEGRAMSTYHRWMEVCALGTLIGAPSLAMPAGFSADGLPIGLQVIGRPRADDEVLDLAAAWEQVTDHHTRRPPLLDVLG